MRKRATMWTIVLVALGLVIRRRSSGRVTPAADTPSANSDPQSSRESSTAILASTRPSPHGPLSATRGQFFRGWVLPLGGISVALVVLAGALLWNRFVDQAPSDSSGGVLVMLDTNVYRPAVEIDAMIWHTGYEGFDMLRLRITGSPDVEAGTRWYVFASGQYGPPSQAPLELFCEFGDLAVRAQSAIRCPGHARLGAAAEVEYNFQQELGMPAAGEVSGIEGHDGYNANNVTAITGLFEPTDIIRDWYVYIPIREIRLGRSGPERQGQLASIAVGDSEFGASIRAFSVDPADDATRYVSTVTGHSLEPVAVSAFELDASDLLGDKRLIWSRPDNVTDDSLIWQSEGGGFPGLKFSLLDANRQGRDSLWAFLGGILVSAALAALLLVVERMLDRREDRLTR